MDEPADHTLALLRRLDRKVDRLEAGQRLVLARLDRNLRARRVEICAEQGRHDLRLDHFEPPAGDISD